MEKMIEIAGRDGQPQVVPASTTPWWEEDEPMAHGIGKAFDAAIKVKRQRPIRIKLFEV
jgi:hypothetical protein